MTIRSYALLAIAPLSLAYSQDSDPKAPFVDIPPTEVLTSKTVQQNGREVTIRKIRPIPLSQPLTDTAPSNLSSLPAVQQRTAELQQEHPEHILIQAAATVFRPVDSPPLSLVRLWWQGGEAVTFWSSADFGYLSGITSFTGIEGKSYNLLLTWSVSLANTRTAVLTETGSQLPAPPEFARDKVSFSFVSPGPVPEETRAAIEALHGIYHREHDRLQAVYDERQQERLKKEAEALADPPGKRPVTLNYWRTETAAPSTGTNDAGKGGTR